MKLLMFSHSAGLAGAELSLVDLARQAVEREYEVVVAVPAPGPLCSTLRDAVPGVKIVRSPLQQWMGRRHRGAVGLAREVQALLSTIPSVLTMRRVAPQVVLVNTSTVIAPVLAAQLLRIPSVVLVRESLETNPMLQSVLPKWLIRLLLVRCATYLVVVSEYVREQLGGFGDVVYHAGSAAAPPVCARAPLTADGGRVLHLLMCGSISPEKGQLDAVRAVELARSAGVAVDLRIFGPGAPTAVKHLRRRISDSPARTQIEYLGVTDRVSEELAQADVSLVCSRNEAYGRVTLESLLAGVPVIGYDAGGTSELCRALGGGLLVPPTPEALAEVLQDVANTSGRVLPEVAPQRKVQFLTRLEEDESRFWSRIAQLAGDRRAAEATGT